MVARLPLSMVFSAGPAAALAALLATLLVGSACVEELELPDPAPAPELEPGEQRSIELRYLRFDVEGFEERLSLADLEAIPQSTLDELWLLDLELTPLVENALTQLASLPPEQVAELPPAARNMRTLLNMTPDNVDLTGTSLAELVALSQAVGIPAARALADIFSIGLNDTFIPVAASTEAVVVGLIASHPATQWREGPVDDAHPDGRWPVAPNSLPITLGDVASNFEDLAARFGPAQTEFGLHPGFVEAATGVSVVEDAFALIVKVDANPLPYKGVDLTNLSGASVNSIASQIESLFPVDDPEWLRVEGLVDEPSISEMTVLMLESDSFLAGGTSREPKPTGNSPAWQLPPWEFERVVMDMSRFAAAGFPAQCTVYELGTGAEAFSGCIDGEHWVEFETFNNLGNPPPPSYAWDVILEIAQVRLHDGGLAEGEADVAFTLFDVPLGIDGEAIVAEIRGNLAANPAALEDLAESIAGNSFGAADFYYWRPRPGGPSQWQGDWLFFVTEDDIPVAEGGAERPYSYDNPGFFADAELTTKLSSTAEVAGDDSHEKLRISAGDRVYVEDDAGRVYRLDVGDKPSPNTLALDVTRVR